MTNAKRVSFRDESLAVSIPPDTLAQKYRLAYEDSLRFIGCEPFESAARRIQTFLKPRVLILVRFNDQESDLLDQLHAISELKSIELGNIEFDKEERMAAVRAEWEEVLLGYQTQDIQKLQQERILRHETMADIEALKNEFFMQKEKNTTYQAKLQREQNKARVLSKLGQLHRQRLERGHLLNELEKEVEIIQVQLEKTENDVAIVTRRNEQCLQCIQRVAEKLGSRGMSYSTLSQSIDQTEPPGIDGLVGAPLKLPSNDHIDGPLDARVPILKQKAGTTPSVQLPSQRPISSRRPTHMLSRMQGYIQLKSKTPVGQKLIDRGQRFAHVREFSIKELSAVGLRPSHLLQRGSGQLRLQVR